MGVAVCNVLRLQCYPTVTEQLQLTVYQVSPGTSLLWPWNSIRGGGGSIKQCGRNGEAYIYEHKIVQ